MNSKRSILYKSNFVQSIREIKNFIAQSSPQNALAFVDGIDPVLEKIKKHPTANPPERFLPTKRNWYRRRIYKKRYKIIYKVLKTKLVFLAVIHTSRHPREIAKLRTGDYS